MSAKNCGLSILGVYILHIATIVSSHLMVIISIHTFVSLFSNLIISTPKS